MTGLTLKVEEKLKGVQTSALIASTVDGLFPKLVALMASEVVRLTPIVTANLASSIVGVHTGFLDGEVSTIVKYAGFVEFGTSKMQPRAMFRKGAVVFKELGLQLIANELKKINT
jgi:hypothetical protein